ncbi:MAG: hypothetical protein K2X91_19130 [Thermoleophilia bacterium]|nr:hypothetical protein [Thermoleophilia bacterium]
MTSYYLAREIEKARAKHKPIALVIPAVDPEAGQHEGYAERKVEVDPPVLWDDSITVLANIDPGRAARMLLGDEPYEHWRAAGGTAGILFEVVRNHAGASGLGESSQS